MFTYSASCDVPEETLLYVTALLHAHRRRCPIRLLAFKARLPISTCDRYLHEAIDVIAEQAPDLHEVLDQAKREGWSRVTLDGTLVEIDRVNERTEVGHHLWYSGKHKTQGANVQILADPAGFPVWSSEVEPKRPAKGYRRWRTRDTKVRMGSGRTPRPRAVTSTSRPAATTRY